jgi:hypothetical protein
MKIRHVVGVLSCCAGLAAVSATAAPAFADINNLPPLPGTPPPSLGNVLPAVPGTPIASATDSSALVAVTPGQIGGLPTSYVVTANPGGATCIVAGPVGSCTVTGLANGASYTFTAVANDEAGSSAPSASSNSVTPTPLPGTPAVPFVIPALYSAVAIVTLPASRPYADFYTVTANPGGQSCTIMGPSGLCSVSGLVGGGNYTFTATAHMFGANSNSEGASSAPSGESTTMTPATSGFGLPDGF